MNSTLMNETDDPCMTYTKYQLLMGLVSIEQYQSDQSHLNFELVLFTS